MLVLPNLLCRFLFNMVLYESFLVVAGIIGLCIGSDIVVLAAKRIANRLQISPLFVGLTIASIGTSLPEIFTNLMVGFSNLQGTDASGIAVGNIIGSNLGQITLILGIVGLFSTLHIDKRAMRRDGFMMFIALFLMFLVCFNGSVSRIEAVSLIVVYFIYLGVLIKQENVIEKIELQKEKGSLLIDFLKCMAGILVIVYAADLVVANGINLASAAGVTDSLIGIFVGLGTSIPELSVSLRAIMKDSGRLSLGNLIGSNITDPLLSFGLGATVSTVTVTSQILHFDFIYWMAATLIALLMLSTHMDLNKKESAILILLYVLFIYLRIMFFS